MSGGDGRLRAGKIGADARFREPAGLYLHVPFCSAICPYCDFAVRVGAPAARAAFVDTLISELGLWGDWAEPIDSVYLGGGTPSLLEVAQLDRLLSAVRSSLPIQPHAHVSLEANPEDVDAQRVRGWRALGVDTLSLGVQSFDAAELAGLGRRHGPEQARRAVALCLEAGFPTVSVNLIFGSAGQSPAVWRRTLEEVVALGAPHVSCYQLTVHSGTAFGRRRARGELSEMPETEQAVLFELTDRVLGDGGWEMYEVSNFARAPAHRSRHNRKYWRHVPYLGLGPSAHSFDGRNRWWNERALGPYTRRVAAGERPIAGREELGPAELALETLMLGLRTVEGIDLGRFEVRFGADLAAHNRPLIRDLVAHGLLEPQAGWLRPTRAGLAIADGLAARFRLGL